MIIINLCLAPSALPPNLTTVSTAPEAIYIEWINIPFEQRNGALKGYKIKYKKYSEKKFMFKYVDYGFTTTTLYKLKPFTIYWIEVAGYNEAGVGPTDYSVVKTLEGGNFFHVLYPLRDVFIFVCSCFCFFCVQFNPCNFLNFLNKQEGGVFHYF